MVFEGLSFGEKYKFDKKIADTSFNIYLHTECCKTSFIRCLIVTHKNLI